MEELCRMTSDMALKITSAAQSAAGGASAALEAAIRSLSDGMLLAQSASASVSLQKS